MKPEYHDITGIILTGGKSSRMGCDKAFLEIEGQPVIRRILNLMQGRFRNVFLVGGQSEKFADYRVETVTDIYTGSSLGGLYTGLCHADTNHIFVTSCDIPFPSHELVNIICMDYIQYDAVLPSTEKGLEPLFAIYSKSCLEQMKTALDGGMYRIKAVLEGLKIKQIDHKVIKTVDPEGLALLNINTPEEYKLCCKTRT